VVEPAIIGKIRRHLSRPVRTESAVVYLLCEVRKLLDQQKPKPDPNALCFYCNWALHAELSYPKTTGVLLKRIDEFAVNRLTKDETQQTLLHEERLFNEFLYLDTFRKELSTHDTPRPEAPLVCFSCSVRGSDRGHTSDIRRARVGDGRVCYVRKGRVKRV